MVCHDPHPGEVARLIEPAWLRPHRSMPASQRRRDDRHPSFGVAAPERSRDLETAHCVLSPTKEDELADIGKG